MGKKLYTNGEYLEKNPTWHTEDSPWKAQQIEKMLDKNSLEPQTVCEVGCGAGKILHQLHESMDSSTRFYGYEISQQAFAHCQNKTKDRLEFHLADLIDEQMSYDLLLVIDVIEHLEDYFGFLKNIKSKAEYKIFHIPLDLSVQTVWRKTPIIRNREQVGHIHYFTKETALASLKETGYKILDHFYTGVSIDAPATSFKRKLLRWPRRACFALNQDLTVRILGGYSLMVLAK